MNNKINGSQETRHYAIMTLASCDLTSFRGVHSLLGKPTDLQELVREASIQSV